MGGVGVTIMQRLDKGMHSYPVIERNTHRALRVSVANSAAAVSSSFPFLTISALPFPVFGLAAATAYKVILAKFAPHVFRSHENFPSRKLLG